MGDAVVVNGQAWEWFLCTICHIARVKRKQGAFLGTIRAGDNKQCRPCRTKRSADRTKEVVVAACRGVEHAGAFATTFV